MTRPPLHKVLRATQSMVPLLPNPWEALAHGLACTRDELGQMLAELGESGALLGLHGESNPALPEAAEWLSVDPPDNGGLTRFRLIGTQLTRHSILHLGHHRDEGPFQSTGWFKCGWSLQQHFVEEGDAFDQEHDRTLFTSPADASPFPALSEVDAKLADALLEPKPINLAHSPWSELADEIDHPGGEDGVIRSLKQLVLHRVFRRISMRWSPSGLGIEGCVLVAWEIPADGAENAARALVTTNCSAEVALRRGDAEPMVTALLMAREPGEGEALAARISRSWNREPAFVEPVQVV